MCLGEHDVDSLKHAFITAPVMLHAEPTKPFQVKTDAFDFVIGSILSQANDNNLISSGLLLLEIHGI